MQRFFLRRTVGVAAFVVLTGCATMPRDSGLSEIHLLVDQRSGEHSWTTDHDTTTPDPVQTLLSQPLGADAAVQVALLRNPRMRSEYARLGLAQADVVEASRLSNPTFSITALHHSGEPTKFEAGLSANFAELLMLPARKRFAAGEYARTTQSIGAAILDLAADTRAAWYTYVGAQQVATMRTAVAAAAQTSAELAGRFFQAGNISALQLRLEQAAATQARLQATRANADATRARSALNAWMGLSADAPPWSTAERLPSPSPQDESVDTLLPLAQQQRLDLAAARQEMLLREQALELTQRYRLLGKIEVGIAGERETDRNKLYGPSLSLQLPFFNQGQATVARARAQLDDARARLQSLELEIDSSVRLGVDRIATARKIAQDYRAALIPQREAIVTHTQEQQNYMLVGVFELLLAKQQEFDAYQGYLEAVRDYWLARVDLMRAVGARLPGDTAETAPTMGPDEILHPRPDTNMQPMHHGGAPMPGMNRDDGEPSAPKQDQEKRKPQGRVRPEQGDHSHDQHGGVQ